MSGIDPQLQAIIEILLLLSLATCIGWILGRLALSGQLRLIRAAVADKEAELELCRSTDETILKAELPAEPAVPEPAPFVPADPLLPALEPDDVPKPVMAEPEPRAAVGVPSYAEPVVPVDLTALAGSSEAAVLNRIAARVNEVNFDRIGRATPAEADDLKDIVGVGPFLERKLHSLGIYTFRQIANFNKEDITKVNELIEFFPGRIDRDNWVDQARQFHDRKYGSNE